MYRICRTFWVETGHFLSSKKNTSNCRMPHGHSRKIEIILASNELDENNMVCDFQILKTGFGKFLDSFDHAMLISSESKHYDYFSKNFDRVIPFEKQDPTSEAIAEKIFKHISAELAKNKYYTNKDGSSYKISDKVYFERVRVWETTNCWAEYSIPEVSRSQV